MSRGQAVPGTMEIFMGSHQPSWGFFYPPYLDGWHLNRSLSLRYLNTSSGLVFFLVYFRDPNTFSAGVCGCLWFISWIFLRWVEKITMKPPFGEYVLFSNHKKQANLRKRREMSHGFFKGWFGGHLSCDQKLDYFSRTHRIHETDRFTYIYWLILYGKCRTGMS